MKKLNSKFGLLGWLLLASVIVMGAKIGGDVLRIGTKTGVDIQIQMGEGRIKWDQATSKIQFSNDSGSTLKDIGSGGGGGGGQNFFQEKSFDAESALLGWTNTGSGTFVLNAVTPINGLNDFAWNAAAQNDLLRTDLIAIPEKFKGQACEMNFTYSGLAASSDLIKPQVLDSSNVKLVGATYKNQVDGSDFLQAQTGIVQRSIFFICPGSGDIKFEFNQTAAGDPALMNYDDVHIGELIGLQTTVIDGDWTSYTPTITGFGTPTAIDFQFRKVGPNIEINGTFTSGTPTAVEAQLSLPNSGVVLSSSVSPITVAGLWIRGVTNVNHGGAILITAGDAFINFGSTSTFGSTSVNSMLPVNSNTMTSSGDEVVVHATIPIEGQAATPVKIFLSIPKVAENINSFSVKISSTDVPSDENVDWIDGSTCTDATLGEATCAFVANTFSLTPNCFCTSNAVTVIEDCHIIAISSTSVTTRTADDGGLASNQNHTLHCEKHSADFKTPTVQPIIVGQVTNSKAEAGGTDNIRVESCRINNNGTATIDTGSTLCETWVSVVTRNSLGRIRVQFISGTFSLVPVCTAISLEANRPMAVDDTQTIDKDEMSFVVETDDRDIHIICIGVR